MSIEDVSYLHTHSVQDSILFFADSSTRDQTHYPTPSEYIVEFTEPIRLVIGVEVIDATIPCTMYAVDAFNDRIDIITVPPTSDNDPVDAEVVRYLAELGATPSAVLALGADGHAEVVVVDAALYAEYAGAVPTASVSSTSASTATTFAVCVRSVHNSVPLTPMNGIAVPSGKLSFMVRGVTYAVAVDEAFAAVVVNLQMSSPTASTVISAVGASSTVPSTYDVVCYEVRATNAAGTSAACTAAAGLLCRLRKYTVHIGNGNYDLSNLISQVTLQLSTQMVIDDSDVVPNTFAAYSSFLKQPVDCTSRIQIAATTPRAFYLDARGSTANEVLGFATQSVVAPVSFGDNLQLFAAVPANGVTTPPGCTYTMLAPGIVNLLGPRYITLRCPEIEKYMYSGMTHGKHSTGIGIFKLPSAGEVSNLRFDFSSLARKPFHPIGRMTRLTLRFERVDGVLYDFKGANNTMLLSVRYLAPKPEAGQFKRSVLNPDYNPDFLAWYLTAGAPADAREISEGGVEEGGVDEGQEGVREGQEGVQEGDRNREVQHRSGRRDDTEKTAAAVRRRRLIESSISRRVLLEQQRYTY